MTRVEKKCLLASSGLHLFALLLLLFGSAFFVAQEKNLPSPKLRVVPTRWVEAALAGGGGNPKLARNEDDVQKGQTLAPVAPQTAPPKKPDQPHPPQPSPPPEPPKAEKPPAKVETPKVEPSKKPTPKPPDVAKPKPTDKPAPKYKIDLSELQPVTRTDKDKEKEREKAKAEADARAAREAAQRANAARQRLAQQFSRTADEMRRGFANGTKVEVGGPGGEAFASYGALVQAAYDAAWVVLPDLNNEDVVTVVRVTIAREGRILSSQILRKSGSASMDKSVQRALDKVKAEGLPPFPDFIKDAERSFTIEFNLKTRKLLG